MIPAGSVAGWLSMPPQDASAVVLCVDSIGEQPMGTWERTAIQGGPYMEVAQMLLAACQDETNTRREPTKFKLQWVNAEGRPLNSKQVKCIPLGADGEALLSLEDQAIADGHPMTAIVSSLLKHKSESHKQALTAVQSAMNHQQELLREAMADRKATNAFLLELLKVFGVRPSIEKAADEDSVIDQAKAVTIDKVGGALADHAVPALTRLAEEHVGKMLTAKADAKPNGKPNGKRAIKKKTGKRAQK